MFVQGAGKSAVLNGLIGHPVLVSTVFFPSFDALITWPESFTCKFFLPIFLSLHCRCKQGLVIDPMGMACCL